MRKIISIALVLAGAFLFAPAALAQFTTVTATVQDPNGIPYAGAVLNAVLVPSTGGGYTLSGQPYSGRIGPVTLDSSGKFTVNFGDVTLITPGSPQWQITISSAAATIGLPLGTGPQQFNYTSSGTTISGSSPVSLTTALNALAPKLTNFASGGSGTISCSISAAVLFETAANTAGCAAGFTFSTPNLTIPVNGSYNIGTTPMLSTPPSGGTPGNNISVGGPSNMSAVTNTALNNLAVGSFVLNTLTTGTADTAVGIGAMATSGTAATSDTAIGHNTMPNVTANLDTAVGDGALASLVSGANNTAVGAGSGGNTTGGSNTLVGFQAGLNLTSGGSNVIIGLPASTVTTGSSNVVIGVSNLSGITATASNQLDILDAIIGTGMGTPASSTVEFKGNLTVDGTCTGCAAAPAFPVTVTGGVSGGVPYFNSTTQESASALLATNALVVGGGAGAAPATGNADCTYATHTLACGAAALIDFSAISAANGMLLPTSAGCGPGTNGGLCYSTANSSFTGKTGGVTAILLSSSSIIANNTVPKSGSGSQSFYTASSIVDNGTTVTTTEPVNAGTYQTATNCKANGTAANPSIAACGSAASGMFSCATNASTGTCTVNTTRVTANSEIAITQNAADGGASQLNVTCNTGNVLSATAPILAAKVAATSFTINLGTVATNPACFEYIIVN